jgi:hypothetical protein
MFVIRKIASFFSQTPFPEFEAFHNSLATLHQLGSSAAAASASVFGPPLDAFIQSQTGAVKLALQSLHSSGRAACGAAAELRSSTEALLPGLSPLTGLGAEEREKKKALKKAEEEVALHLAILEAIQADLGKARARASQAEADLLTAEAGRTEEDLARARDAEAAARREAEEARTGGNRRFFDTVVDQLLGAADAQLKAAAAREAAANDILEAVARIEDYEDRAVPILRQKLEELESPVPA